MNENLKNTLTELDENIQERCTQIRKTNALLADAWSSEASCVCLEQAHKISRDLSQISDEITNISATGD